VIGEIKRRHREVLVSVDTYHSVTAESAIEAGADIINDISGLTFDAAMGHVAAKYRTPVVIMHTGGRPEDMQKNPYYEDVVQEVYDFLAKQMDYAVSCGIPRESLMIDLGIGFGKTYAHNLALLRSIERFGDLGAPHLMAVSRKSFVGAALGASDPAERLYGTMALSVYGAEHGIELARVHDVKPNLDAVRMWETLRGSALAPVEPETEDEARMEAEWGRR
jgi:dihydropteroate synthase